MVIDKIPGPPEKYNVVVSGLKEVTLVGSADPTFWKERLKPEGLNPYVKDGRAELLIATTDSRWLGMPFKELTIAISICLAEGCPEPQGLFLIQAFNSRRFFAFIERSFYQTPYDLGAISVKSRPPLAIKVGKGGDNYLSVDMAEAIPGLGSEADRWEGPIFLPGKPAVPSAKHKLFYARLAGVTQRYPFHPDVDRLLINRSAGLPVFQWLLASNFTGQEWRLRVDATHARSRTYKWNAR